jgi:CheY-like chemotaxis protein
MAQSPRILIVEDEVMIAMCLELELKQAGYTVCQRAVTGEDAIRIAQQESPDCILMDIRLAGDIDGIEVAQQIQRQLDSPIIFMTGYPDKAVEERAKTLKPLGYFIKPIRARTLKPLLDSL